MARLFDNNAANYMSRASVNLGLNGATACSWGFWINITAVNVANQQRLLAKEINGLDGWNSIWSVVGTNATTLQFEVENNSTGAFPDWTLNTGIGTGVWTRILFTWARTASAVSTDAVVYVNGQAVATTFTANGYTNTFTILENSSNLYYGIRPITLTQPFNGSLAWVCIWNRQLTAQEALIDYTNPRNVKSGLLSIVELSPDTDQGAIGGSMTINGTVNIVGGPPIVSAESPMRTNLRARPFAPGLAR